MTPQEKKQVIKNHFSSLGKKGAAAVFKKDPNHFKKLSKLGAEARRNKGKYIKAALTNLDAVV